VLERRFDWRNKRHRRALDEDELELPGDDPRFEDLARVQPAYRRAFRSEAAFLARRFGDVIDEC
jgi:hypothetical protein